MEFKYKRKRVDKITSDQILSELEKAAKIFDYTEFGWRDFNNVANISASTVKKHYGSWKKGLEALRKRLQDKDLDLRPRPFAPNRLYSDKELFIEMERIWKLCKQRPSRTEWESSNPKISYQCYKQRFGGWVNACNRFIEYKMGKGVLSEDVIVSEPNIKTEDTLDNKKKYKNLNTRNIPLSVRLKVLNRDNFSCVYCGKSPATDLGTELQIDHIKPFSKGGKSVLENLQTLCRECNLGKGNSSNLGHKAS